MIGCVDGKLNSMKISCSYPFACDPADPTKCAAPDAGCTEDNKPFCEGDSVKTCIDGKKSLVAQCRYGCDLSKAECGPECSWSGNLFDSASNTLKYCDAQGRIIRRTTCAYGYDIDTNSCKTKFMGLHLSFKNNGKPMYLKANRVSAGYGNVSLTNNKSQATLFQKRQVSEGTKYTAVLNTSEDPYVLVGNGSTKKIEMRYDKSSWSGGLSPFWSHAANGQFLFNRSTHLGQKWALVAQTSGAIAASTPVIYHYQVSAPDLGMSTLKLQYITKPNVIARFGINVEEVYLYPKTITLIPQSRTIDSV